MSAPTHNRDARATIDAHRADFQPCLSIDHGLAAGTLKVRITVEADGHVSRTRISHASKNAVIDRCIAGVIETFTFPKSSTGTSWVSAYPFYFSASQNESPERLSEEQIDKAVAVKDPEIWACYSATRAKHPDFVASLDLVIIVDAEGHVTDVRVRATSSDVPTFDACVVARMKTVEFPAPSGGVGTSFVYPLGFSP